MKKYLFLFLTLFLVFPTSIQAEEMPTLASQYAIVMEVDTKRVLFEKNAYEKAYPASMTKVMTILLALEKGNLQDTLTVDQESITSLDPNSSVVPLYTGEKLTLDEMLYGCAIASGNETCNVIGKYISGSIDDFIDLMNEKALSIGASNTHFMNAHGLHHSQHYTTAYDMALMMEAGIKNEDFIRYLSATQYTIEQTDQHQYHRILGHNDLLNPRSPYYLNGIICSKTGHTDEARYTQVGYFQIEGLSFIIVTMDCETTKARYQDFSILYHYVLNHYQSVHINDYLLDPLSFKLPAYLKYQNKENPFYIEETTVTIFKDIETYPITYDIQFNTINKTHHIGESVGSITFYQDQQSLTLPILTKTEIVRQIPWYVKIPLALLILIWIVKKCLQYFQFSKVEK